MITTNHEALHNPFRKLLWQIYKLREAEKAYNLYDGKTIRNVSYWQSQIDDTLATIGIDENTDWKNLQLTII